jgi:hypothetical protein
MNNYYEITAVFKECGTTEVMYGSFDKSEVKSELDECKQGWKCDGYKGFKIITRQTDDTPDPEIYGDELYKKAVCKALQDKDITISVSDTSVDYFDLENSRLIADIFEACEATDSPVITIFKGGESIGYMLILCGYGDESIADYSVSDFMNEICASE